MSFAGLTGESIINYYNTNMKIYYVYILASGKNGTLYAGVTSNLEERVWQHKEKVLPNCFTAKYGVDKLVYFEYSNDVFTALNREKSLKRYKRQWKIDLIQEMNPEWRDLYEDLVR